MRLLKIYKKNQIQGGVMSELFLIHEPDVFFNVCDSVIGHGQHISGPTEQLHQGEIYISLGQIYLHGNRRWYTAKIQDIQEIKTIVTRRQMIIRFWDFTLILSCKKFSHLMALRDFLFLTQNVPTVKNIMPEVSNLLKVNDVYHRVYERKIKKYQLKNC